MGKADQQYLKAIRTGDDAGLRSIYLDFLPRITSLITRNGGTHDDAQDVFQDALVLLFEKCRDQNFVLSSAFSTLLYGICRNLWGNRLQKRSRSEVTLLDDFKYTDDTDLVEALISAERERILWDNFRQLGKDCQQILTLFFTKKNMQEIADLMDFTSAGYAKKRKFQCKATLLEKIKTDPRYREFMS
jgi:RNA polymerase sigma factor (sigma-70 family)